MLQPNQEFVLHGIRYRVAYVNSCRAHCKPVSKVQREINGKSIWFTAGHPLDISPNSAVKMFEFLRIAGEVKDPSPIADSGGKPTPVQVLRPFDPRAFLKATVNG